MWTCPASGLLHTPTRARAHTHTHTKLYRSTVCSETCFFFNFPVPFSFFFYIPFLSFFFMFSFLFWSFSYIRFSFVFPFLFLSYSFLSITISRLAHITSPPAVQGDLTQLVDVLSYLDCFYNSQIRLSNPDEECDVWTWATKQTTIYPGDCTTGYKLVHELV